MRKELLDGFVLLDKRVEPLTGTVRASGGETHLPPKSVEVLLCLASRPLTLVSREEILERVWGSTDTSQEILNRTISEIRNALGDSPDAPTYIQTVPKRGFRLLVEPDFGEASDAAAAKPESRIPVISTLIDRGVIQSTAAFLVVGWLLIQVADAVVPTLALPPWTTLLVTYIVIGGLPVVVLLSWFFEYAEGRFYVDRGRESPTVTTGIEKHYLTVIAAYAIAVIGAFAYQMSVGFDVPAETSIVNDEMIEVEPNSIAVLRFMNIDGSERSQIFAYGVAEDVLDRLARIPGLLVSARGDSWSLPANSVSTEVRKRLRVAYYLEGSVRIVDNELRVVAQLIDSATGFHIVSRGFDKKIENFMEVQREITNLVVANLRVALPEDTQMVLAGDFQGTNVDAYVIYRRARELLSGDNSPGSLNEAEMLLQQALEIDSGYAAAHAGMCELRISQYFTTNNAEHIDRAETSCANALATNPNLYMVHTALGTLYGTTGRHSQAEAAFLKALDINSQDVEAMLELAHVYESLGRIDEAEALLAEASRLQPGNWENIDSLGYIYFANGRYEDAIREYRRVTQLDPGNSQGHGNLGSALLMTGEFTAAAEALETALEIQPDLYSYSNLGIIYYYLGQYSRSVEIHRKAIELSPDANFAWLNLADSLMYDGRTEDAMDAFRRAAELARSNLNVNPQDTERLYELAWALTMLGETDTAERLIERSISLDAGNPYVFYYDALIKHYNGRDREALDALAAAVDTGYPATMLANEPHLAGLRDDHTFRALADMQD